MTMLKPRQGLSESQQALFESQQDLFAVWPDDTECPLNESACLKELVVWKGDDYEIKRAVGYDEKYSPIFG